MNAAATVALADYTGSVRDRAMAGSALALDGDPASGWRMPATRATTSAVGLGGGRAFDGTSAMHLIWRGGTGRGGWLVGAAGYDAGSIELNGADGSTRTINAAQGTGFMFGGSYRRGPISFGASLLQGRSSLVGVPRPFSEFRAGATAQFWHEVNIALVFMQPWLGDRSAGVSEWPGSIEAGLGWVDVIVLPVARARLSVSAAAVRDRGREATSFSGGFETTLNRFVIRMGARGGSLDGRMLVTSGFGVMLGRWCLDYAVELTPPDGSLTPHQVGLAYRWSKESPGNL